MAVSVLLICCSLGIFFNSVSRTISASVPSKQPDGQHSSSLVEQILKQIDPSVDPCDSMYNLACGKFRNETVVPDDLDILESSYLMQNQIKEQLKRSLEEESPPDELHALKLVKKFYRSCMNEAAIEEKGLNPLRDLLNRLGTWPVLEGDNWNEKDFSWVEVISKMNAVGIAENFFLPLNVSAIRYNNTKKLRLKWLDISSSPKFPTTVAELIKEAPSIPWKEFFQRMLPENITIDESEEIFFEDFMYIFRLSRAISETSKRTQANFLMYRIFLYCAPFLNAEMRQRHVESQYRVISDLFRSPLEKPTDSYKYKKPSERWIQCLDTVSQHMYPSLARLYIPKYFANETMQKAIEITANIKQQFRLYLHNFSKKLDRKSRTLPVDKLDAMEIEIGYPEEIFDDAKLEEFYTGLIIDENDFFNSFLNVIRSKRAILFNNFRADVNESFISFDGLKGGFFNAHYIYSENKIYIPFGAIQVTLGVIGDSPQYVNYGRLGFMIANEMIHGFDSVGEYYDKNGRYVNDGPWWTPPSKNRFARRARGFKVYPGINGTIRLVMLPPISIIRPRINILVDKPLAYYTGLEIAYMSYRDLRSRNDDDSGLSGLPFSPNQLFLISVVNSMCNLYQKDPEFDDPYHPRFFAQWYEFRKGFKCSI